MNRQEMLVGLGATKARWSAELRSYVRDHLTGIRIEAVLDAGQLARPGRRRFDVVLLDDMSRVFSGRDVATIVGSGTVVIGLYDTDRGLGRSHLERLGVSRLLPASVPTSELARVMAEIGPVNAGSETVVDTPDNGRKPVPSRRGALTALFAVSGGVGTSEASLAIAERWSQRLSALVVEANPVSAALAARLGRDPAFGLGWALGRVAQGQAALPDGLTPRLQDTAGRFVGFDVISQSSTPGGPPVMNPSHLVVLIEEARALYDEVVVECGVLLAGPSGVGGDRFAAGRAVLSAADRVLVFAGADPEGAIRLLEWRAATVELGMTAPAWAVFGRVPRRGGFELSQLKGVLERSTGEAGFVEVFALPEDQLVARARWNGEPVQRGPWSAAIERLCATVGPVRSEAGTGGAQGTARRLSLAGEVGW